VAGACGFGLAEVSVGVLGDVACGAGALSLGQYVRFASIVLVTSRRRTRNGDHFALRGDCIGNVLAGSRNSRMIVLPVLRHHFVAASNVDQ
jgi:hypothetical protein